MFCFQCEQTRRTEAGAGCTGAKGVCGKDEVTADLQDLLIYQLKGIGQYRTRLGAFGRPNREAGNFVLFAWIWHRPTSFTSICGTMISRPCR
jgi:hydroxylamine reductase